ncbi:MAG: hypothetical protein NT083_03425 [Rhodocyclales bacterium]|nr:hypothetical protein [Rhodocyclales bacterium]
MKHSAKVAGRRRGASILLLVAGISLATACSRSQPEATSGSAGAGPTQPDYKKICQHLAPLATAEKKDAFAGTCEETYRRYLPSCSNAAAVTDCFANIKSWDERLACLDSCKRDTPPAR